MGLLGFISNIFDIEINSYFVKKKVNQNHLIKKIKWNNFYLYRIVDIPFCLADPQLISYLKFQQFFNKIKASFIKTSNNNLKKRQSFN